MVHLNHVQPAQPPFQSQVYHKAALHVMATVRENMTVVLGAGIDLKSLRSLTLFVMFILNQQGREKGSHSIPNTPSSSHPLLFYFRQLYCQPEAVCHWQEIEFSWLNGENVLRELWQAAHTQTAANTERNVALTRLINCRIRPHLHYVRHRYAVMWN